MNQIVIRLADFMNGLTEGWGRDQGRDVYGRLLKFMEMHSEALIFKVSLAGVRRVDISFASETVVELAKRYRRTKGFCFIDLTDPDMRENWEAAAVRKEQPIMMRTDSGLQVLGLQPSSGLVDALEFALTRTATRAAEFVRAHPKRRMTLPNASSKFKQLWQKGFLLRQELTADSGGIEYAYFHIG